jgi:hypothetical protein
MEAGLIVKTEYICYRTPLKIWETRDFLISINLRCKSSMTAPMTSTESCLLAAGAKPLGFYLRHWTVERELRIILLSHRSRPPQDMATTPDAVLNSWEPDMRHLKKNIEYKMCSMLICFACRTPNHTISAGKRLIKTLIGGDVPQ